MAKTSPKKTDVARLERRPGSQPASQGKAGKAASLERRAVRLEQSGADAQTVARVRDGKYGKIARIRTSDRSLFKRCRRKWNWQSHLRHNLDVRQRQSYFWIGTGGHFALEDYHGFNQYGHPVEAFRAYVNAYKKWVQNSRGAQEMPDDWKEQVELGEAILDYYVTDWLSLRDPLKTLWVDGYPQVELNIEIPLPFTQEQLDQFEVDAVIYGMKLDRIVVIEDELWVQDYKFYKSFNTSSLDWDEQMSAYVWGASCVYDMPVAGAIHHQFKKQIPCEPKLLANGRLSTDLRQGTTHRLYRKALEHMYGETDKAPMANREFLGHLAELETSDRDEYILRERTYRTIAEQQATGTQIMMEVEEMLNPNLPIYPNHTKDCSWDCQLNSVCQNVDRDDDWEAELEDTATTRTEENEGWRKHLPTP